METSSFQCKSAQDSVIKNVGIPSCFTIARTSYRNLFKYFTGLNLISLSTLYPNFLFGNKYGKASSFELCFFPSPGAMLSYSEVGEFDIITVSCELNPCKPKGF